MDVAADKMVVGTDNKAALESVGLQSEGRQECNHPQFNGGKVGAHGDGRCNRDSED